MISHSDAVTRIREAAGLPNLCCPNCGMRNVAHWIPDSLDDYGVLVPGFYTCEAKP